ncbi:hypothetical protein [Catenulispora pinisilvae]|uniref:hypothetical protein n=1 Tax=Catenulispora pinisilvae TaxID=2705253 RepID=UPI0018922CE9|nr:hypothetical protein [Catenulispora pinisilvae]
MSQNPNWPRFQVLWAPAGHIGYGASADSYNLLPWLDISNRLIGPWNIDRGRQYELDQVTTGTWSGTLDNRDGLFDPGNTASTVGGNVVPYQPFRVRAQWPVTVNLLDPDAATGGETSGLAAGTWGTDFGVSGDVDTPRVFATGTAWSGTQVWQVEPYGAAVGNSVITYGPIPLPAGSAGLPFAFSIRSRSVTTGANPTVVPFLRWLDAAGNTVSTTTVAAIALTGSPTAAWSFAGVPATAPARAASVVFGLTLSVAPAGDWFLQADGAQFEQNSGASTFTVPGRWYNLFTGGIERYPQSWRAGGTLGQVQATAVDALALLSQSKLDDPFMAAAFKPAGGPFPTFAYLLGDGGGGFVDSVGQRSVAQVGVNLFGAGTVTSGTARTSATPGGVFVCPAGTTVVNFSGPATPGTNNANVGMSYIRLPPANSGAIGPGAGGFTRMIAFRITAAPAVYSSVWMASLPNPGPGAGVKAAAGLLVGPDLTVYAVIADPNHQGTASMEALGKASLGDWNLAFFYLTADGTELGGGLNYSSRATAATPAYTAFPAGGFRDDVIGASFWGAYYPDQCQYNFVGDIALAIEWPGVLSTDQIDAIYNAFATGWAGDSSGDRFSRILGSAGWNGPAWVDSGDSESLSPAVDIADTDAGTALQAVTDTEGGVMFVDAAGNLVLQARSARWNPAPSTVVFGENTAGGEWPYLDQPVFDYDPTLVTNLAEITHSASGVVFTASDFPSQIANGTRDRQVTSQASNTQECQDKAQFLVVRYKTSRVRVASMTVNPSANPAMWPVVLGLDLGDRAKAVRRPPAPAAPVVVDGFVENIAWAADITGDARLTVQISPADTTGYGVFDTSTFDNFVFAY